MHTELMAWHDKLKKALARNGHGPTTVGKEVGVAPGTISKWLSGTNQPPFSTFAKMCDMGRVTPNYVLNDSEPDDKPNGIDEQIEQEIASLGKREALRRLLADSQVSPAGEWARDLGAVDLPQPVGDHKKTNRPRHPSVTSSFVPPPETPGRPPEIKLGNLAPKTEPLGTPKAKRKPL